MSQRICIQGERERIRFVLAIVYLHACDYVYMTLCTSDLKYLTIMVNYMYIVGYPTRLENGQDPG